MATRKLATIQVDLDGLWTNLKYYGYNNDSYPDSVFDTAVPRFLELFDKYNIKATFFLIGKDGEIKEKAALIKELNKSGHEIANHTYSHPFGFRKLSIEQKKMEINKGSEIIEKIINKKPLGFKAPGYDIDLETLKILFSEGYQYDSSIIPTFVYPLVMKFGQLISGGIKRNHGPKLNWALAPNNIYIPSQKNEWRRKKRKEIINIMELPCSVMPFFKLPFHATFAGKFGYWYFNFGYKLAKINNIPLNYEFHALDLADEIKDKRLAHINIPLRKRKKIFEKIVKTMSKDYRLVTSTEFINKWKKNV